MYVTAGAASFLNIGLTYLIEKLNGNFFIPNLIFVVLTIPMIYIAYLIGKALDRDVRAKEELHALESFSAPAASTYPAEQDAEDGNVAPATWFLANA